MKEIIEYIEQQIRYYNSQGEEQVQDLDNSGDEEFAKVEAYEDVLKELKDLQAIDAMIEKLPETPKMNYLYCGYDKLKSLNNGNEYKGYTIVKSEKMPIDTIYFTPYPICMSDITFKE